MLYVLQGGLLALATKISAATIPSVGTPNLSLIRSPLLDVTSLETIDQRFTTTTQRQGPDLDVDAFLLSVVHAMAAFTLLNFTDAVVPSTPTGPGTADVVVVPRAARVGGTIEARFLVWGLYAGVRGLIAFEIFQAVELTLKWDGKVVRYLKIMKPNAPSALEVRTDTHAFTLPSIGQSSSPPTLTTSNETGVIDTLHFPNIPKAQHTAVQFTAFGRNLKADDVIITILKALLFIAEFDKDRIVRPVRVTSPAPYEATLAIGQYASGPPAGTQPFTYALAVLSLLTIPQRSVPRGTWSEARFNVMVDGVAVGKGAIVKGRR